ncbi:hypothetical protein [Streptomyces apocyni]|uniref:hypothetical protein n=1 Tax=Streptomyces apocyni TaxID=2654677 RepID=UPI0012E9DC92|nr:hypothetical protein [Streptomyces apocyni]
MSDSRPYKDQGDDPGDGAYQWGPAQPPGMGAYGQPQYPTQPMQPFGQPMQPMYPMGGAPLLAIGDITVIGDQIVTPSGTMPLKGAVWNATDFSRVEEKIPSHAIVLAVVFALFCLLGLLFLLMKEQVTTGYIQVTVTSGGRHHATMIPATGPQTLPWVMGQLNYARSLSI